MKFRMALLLLFAVMSTHSQKSSQDEVKQVIEEFFKGFHQRDSVIIKKTLATDVNIGTISKNSEDKIVFTESSVAIFLQGLLRIPKEVVFEEKLLSFQVNADKFMAHVWISYEFWYNGGFSHCGVNSFQLMKTVKGWQIITIIDTRYRKGCSKTK
jgi:hypothetical protein